MYRSPFFLKMALLLLPPPPWSFPGPPSCGGLETILRREKDPLLVRRERSAASFSSITPPPHLTDLVLLLLGYEEGEGDEGRPLAKTPALNGRGRREGRKGEGSCNFGLCSLAPVRPPSSVARLGFESELASL